MKRAIKTSITGLDGSCLIVGHILHCPGICAGDFQLRWSRLAKLHTHLANLIDYQFSPPYNKKGIKGFLSFYLQLFLLGSIFN